MNCLSFQEDSGGAGFPPGALGMLLHGLHQLRRMPEIATTLEPVTLGPPYAARFGIAEATRRFSERIEHRLQVEGRAADDLEHVGSCGLLLQRLAQLVE